MYATTLKYAGAKPFKPEEEREDINQEEYEALTQDPTYKRLAELRYIAEKVENDVHDDELMQESNAYDALFEAVGVRDAPLHTMVDRYVNQWLATQDVQEVEA